MSGDAGYVFVLRDPDYSNDITAFGCNPEIIDIDLGYMDLADDREWPDWIEGHVDACEQLVNTNPEAQQFYASVLNQVAEKFHHALPYKFTLENGPANRYEHVCYSRGSGSSCDSCSEPFDNPNYDPTEV